ncbi:MAG TPA: PP2C family serine/threonine-protein phosphatase [Pseudonocardia sp.]|jgi:serine/threonine protein phosphatase PrpC|uniref:PP2C family serine/threonine-protein phosphatase n=1 Tax=Pseudonocardia sp. TaxID=60912 RepID=UPI002B4AFD76|nr:PP2C family serine/threonine-protein phosphatase [Pseudonocardia sp.]HLU60509.1 PP2C family serine/threonine-protein phosphatase [Pseudonocardia sp.]
MTDTAPDTASGTGPAAACPRCREPVDEHRFCESCGHDLWLRRGGAARPPTGPCPGCGANGARPASGIGVDAAGEDYCGTCGLRLPDGTEHVEADLGRIAGVSDRGLVHVRNEDAMAVGLLAAPGRPPVIAAIVCDGVSTVDAPELASRAGADAALERLLGPGGPDMAGAVAAAAAAVAELAEAHHRNPPSCTLVAAVVEPGGEPGGESGGGPLITVGWVGDSRAYWLAAPDAAEPSRLLTVDHSWAVEMISTGALDAETALADRRAHAITRWLGAGGEPEPDVVTLRPAGPGLLLLCSDGLWNYVPRPTDLAEVALPALARGGPAEVARLLTTIALDAGGRDNVTVVAVPVGPPEERRTG